MFWANKHNFAKIPHPSSPRVNPANAIGRGAGEIGPQTAQALLRELGNERPSHKINSCVVI